ncbi:MAG: peptidase U32 family protein [Solirubrobacterales bacterium]
MKIMIPCVSLETAKLQIAAGADELYLGYDTKEFKLLTYNARWRIATGQVNTQVQTIEELRAICEYAHQRGVKAYLTANANILIPTLRDGFIRYIKECLETGIDGIIVSNIGLIKLVREAGLDIPIFVGVNTVSPNVGYLDFYKKYQVQRIVLPQNITLPEIEEFCKQKEIEIEIFCHIGGGNICGRCTMNHDPLEIDLSSGCRGGFEVEGYDGKYNGAVAYLDAAADCSICHIDQLMEMGVSAVKITGRESANPAVLSKIVGFYRMVIDGVNANQSVADTRALFRETNPEMWKNYWEPTLCDRDRCRFNETKITMSYI